ncbi:hypothetical protein ACFQJ5_01830 [Halomicroarcula sp. GCM10025324]|jgi:hypothetical protein|uniref:hypothetical protein n=1 Tax=Haloarcula TaxID=2237 RepID=UPI0023E7DDED|nr:hypothetical protein [Halomicroarcula sp. ZS-22-S1]
MDDVARLRRTVRRCTAVVVTALGLVLAALAGSTMSPVGAALSVGALLYLAASFVFVPEWAADSDGDDAAADH